MNTPIKKIGIVGCGAIGSRLAKFIQSDLSHSAKVIALSDVNNLKALELSRSLKSQPRQTSINALIKKCDLIIESSIRDVSYGVVRQSLRQNKDILVMSVGGLIGKKDIFKLLNKSKGRLFIPSGAICGLDALKALALIGIDKIELRTYKSVAGLKESPYVINNKIKLKNFRKETMIFEGNVIEAVKNFPANINVAATLSLLLKDENKLKIKIFTGPEIKRNIHKIKAESGAGSIVAETYNQTCPDNPKTSFLAVLSAQSILNGIFSNLRIGS
jgi:aspartate dehydrogenase